jgi:GNAT superfamily N-acetyltransferase
MTGQETLSASDIERLAALQVATLPTSLVSRLGRDYAAAFYRFLETSPQERLFVARDGDGLIVAGCVTSLDITTLQRRLLTGTPLLGAFLPRTFKLLPQMLRGGGGASPKGAELVLLFTDPSERGRGHAGVLVAQAEAALRERGVTRYSVRTFDDPTDPALRFYLRKGFARAGSFIANGAAFQLLEKRL